MRDEERVYASCTHLPFECQKTKQRYCRSLGCNGLFLNLVKRCYRTRKCQDKICSYEFALYLNVAPHVCTGSAPLWWLLIYQQTSRHGSSSTPSQNSRHGSVSQQVQALLVCSEPVMRGFVIFHL